MVTSTKTKAAAEAIGAGALSPDEARRKWFGLGTVAGGDTPVHAAAELSLAALAERDADRPSRSRRPPAPARAGRCRRPDDEAEEKQFLDTLTKSLSLVTHKCMIKFVAALLSPVSSS